MSVTQGTVKLRVEVSGSGDQATRAVKGVREEIDKTTRSSGLLADSTGAVKERIGGLKSSVGGLNAVREGFENLRSNAGFVIGTVTALGGVLIGVVSEIANFVTGGNEASKALEEWGKRQADFNAALEKGWSALDKFTRSPVEAALSDVNVQLRTAESLLKAIRGDEEEWAKKSKEVEGLKSLQVALQQDIARDAERTADAWERIKRSMAEAAIIDVPLISPFIGNSDDPELKVTRNIFGEVESDLERGAREKRLQQRLLELRKRGGGGGSKVDWNKRFDDIVAYNRDKADRTKIIGEPTGGPGNITLGGLGEAAAASSDVIKPLVSDALKLSEAFDAVATSLGLVGEQMPELGSALSEIQGIAARTADGQFTLAEALAAGAAAGAANVARSIGGVRAEAAVRSAYEFGMGWATLDNPPISIGHFTASGLLALVAGGAGRGSSGGGGATRTASVIGARSTRVSTATQIGEAPFVQQINAPWFGGLQEGGAYLWQVYQRAQGTGYGEAA